MVGNSNFFNTLTNEARQRLIDIQQRTEALRAVRVDLRHRFLGSMAWKPRNGRDYLYRKTGRIEKALGPRAVETERTYATFSQGKAAALEREAGLRQTLEGMARINRAMGLGRVPRAVARILRRLDDAAILGSQVCVVGTNALFAYEAAAGIRFGSDLLATADIDVALDARRNLHLTAQSLPTGLLGLLRQTDATFAAVTEGSFRAVNASGLMVDLIVAEPRRPMTVALRRKRRLGDIAVRDDVVAVEVPRLEMIVDAPRFAATAVAEDGLPVWISAAAPVWWAAHKLWLGSEPTRDPLKRQRDTDQGMAVATMLARAWGPTDFSDRALASIPIPLREALHSAIAAAEKDSEPPAW